MPELTAISESVKAPPSIHKNGFFALLRADREAMRTGHNPLVWLGYFFMRPECLTVFLHRIASGLFRGGIIGRLFGKIAWRINVFLSACHLDPIARIGGGLMLPHPTGIIIGNATIGKNVKIHQNVSIGLRHSTSNNAQANYPVIGDNVVIGAGAVILGGITIGDSAVIGANAVVLNDIPAGCLAVGIPAQIVKPAIA